MAKKRKAKKAKIKRKRTAKKNNPKKRSSRKPVLRAVATSEKEEAEVPQARTPHDIFEGIKGRRPKSDQELNEWLASPEGKAAMAFEPTSLSRWGKRDGHRIGGGLSENRSDVLIRRLRDRQRLHFMHQQSRQSLSHNSRFFTSAEKPHQ